MIFQILGLVVGVIGLLLFIDADLITFFAHLYRKAVVKNGAFKKKCIWIVGASSGIGEHLAYTLVREKASCLVLSARRAKQLERVKSNCKKINSECKIFIEAFDVTSFNNDNAKQLHAFMDRIFNKAGDINILVLNAGISYRGRALDTSLKVFKTLWEIDTLSICEMARTFLCYIRDKKLQDKQRYVCVTSSIAGKIGAPGQAPYAMSKHGVHGYFDGLRCEAFMLGVNIGLVCPGATALTENSGRGIGESVGEESGRMDDKEKTRKDRMSVEKCADYYATTMYFQLMESWITKSPTLFFTYMRQYAPLLFMPAIVRSGGKDYLKKMTDKSSKQ